MDTLYVRFRVCGSIIQILLNRGKRKKSIVGDKNLATESPYV